jgi:hypothetical protein
LCWSRAGVSCVQDGGSHYGLFLAAYFVVRALGFALAEMWAATVEGGAQAVAMNT